MRHAAVKFRIKRCDFPFRLTRFLYPNRAYSDFFLRQHLLSYKQECRPRQGWFNKLLNYMARAKPSPHELEGVMQSNLQTFESYRPLLFSIA